MKQNIAELFAREHQAPYSKSIEVLIDGTASAYPIPDLDFFRDHFIIGMSIRKQNSGDLRRSKTGYKLANDSILCRMFLTLSQNQTVTHDKIALEYLVHEPSQGAGSYFQVLIEEGFSPQNSNIFISGGAQVLDGETKRSVEITFYYLPKVFCSSIFDNQ